MMSWSWRLCRVTGIDVLIHWSFLLLPAWAGGMTYWQTESVAASVTTVLFVMVVFACVVLHELGHALVARRYGIVTRDIVLLPIGGLARLEAVPEDPLAELWIALAGPAVNLAIAAALGLGIAGLSDMDSHHLLPSADSALPVAVTLFWVNVLLVVFNLLPAFPMDGGRVLRALLALKLERLTATRIAVRTGQAMAVLFLIAAWFATPFLVLVAAFVAVGAAAELRMVRARTVLADLPARAAMVTDFAAVSPFVPLRALADQLFANGRRDIPVADSGGVCGVLQRADVIQALEDGQSHRLVGELMRPLPVQATESTLLRDVLPALQETGAPILPVVRGHELVGVVTVESVNELIAARTTAERTPAAN